ncbi:collagen alpha-6(VI) chain isoform X1 [Biomphalaria glabrata]|uniref:Collagen alpha-6(VI) chain isoform X1 n=2 Tax=Biomphalaria glabrata TaxID=6526 RepID=A0A9W2Z2K6_BIOGL|nr:collagen alpha-6(VI) chain isoform X1 [Biomphalaria glabrata]
MGQLTVLALILLVSLCHAQRRTEDFDDYNDFDTILEECRDKVMDIYFILDSSTSIWIKHYEKLPPFVQDVINRFDIGSSKTRAGALAFSVSVHNPVLRINRFSDKASLKNYITLNNFPYLTGVTNTYEAIRVVRESSDFRRNITKVIVVLTDGGSSSPGQTYLESNLARKQGFYLFVVGLGIYSDLSEWNSIADDPDRDFVFNGTNFEFTNFLKDDLARRACRLPPKPILPECQLNDFATTDLYFVSGSYSALNSAYQYATAFGDQVRGRQPSLRVNYFFQNCRVLDTSIGRVEEDCPRNIPTRQTPVYSLVSELLVEARQDRDDRFSVRQVAVIILDDAAAQSFRSSQLDELQNDGIIVILVDLTTRQSISNLRNQLRDRDDYVRPIGLEPIARNMIERTCIAINSIVDDAYVPPN